MTDAAFSPALQGDSGLNSIWDALASDSGEGIDISALTDSELKSAASRACALARTTVNAESGKGYEIISPGICQEKLREECRAVYMKCSGELKKRSRMYIPEPIESAGPDRSRLISLMDSYLGMTSSRSKKEQADGQSFNRLFGSRG